ncbi:hypothetical protein [Mucilaginibacter glaciei]|uniref:Uncharacterized protein n=1 Tax=Mucilaginibacter glaciei TaxID=2772109 RepID=A0A926S3P0_9SPHI|nr:hypothetical protein [Mucilaginibacter glaciei]MBD1395423.1 hypothetical protein [Mucilaginibacter glaciei]
MKKAMFVFFTVCFFSHFEATVLAQSKVTVMADSLKAKGVRSAVQKGKKFSSALKDTARSTKYRDKATALANDKIAAFSKSFNEQLGKLSKQTLAVDLMLENKNRYNPLSEAVPGMVIPGRRQVSEFNVIGIARIYGIPVNVNYSTNRLSGSGSQLQGLNNNLFKFDFDPRQFSDMFKTDLEQYYDLRRQAFGGLDLTQYTRKMITEQLQGELDRQKTGFTELIGNKALAAYLNKPENLTGLLQLDERQIRDKLSKVLLENNSLLDKAASVTGKLEKEYKEAEARYSAANRKVDSIGMLITTLKEQLHKKGYDVAKMIEVQKYLEDPRRLAPSEMVNSYMKRLPQTKFQNLFSNIRELKLGSYSKNVPGALKSNDLFLSGSHLTFLTNGQPITIGYGGTNDLKSFKDAGFQNSVYGTPQNITYISTEVTRGMFGKVKLSFIGSVSREISNNNYTIPAALSNNLAFTVNRSFKLGKLGEAALDLSRSTTILSKNYQVSTEAVLDSKAGLNNPFGQSFLEAFAFGGSHHLEMEKSGLSENVYFSYSGLGYQNPGNTGNGGARRKMGGSLRKSLFNNKLIVNFRTDLNRMPISYTSGDQWKTYQVQFDSRYTINRKFNVSLKYNNSGTDKQVNQINTSVYSFQKVQFDGNASFKIGTHASVSHLTTGLQVFSNSYSSASAGNLLMVNYIQSVLMKKNAITLSVFYNKELSGYQLIGDMLNADAAYQYSLFHKINLSTAATFLNNSNSARQFGIKQGIQLYAGSHFDLDSYLDLRKNLITPLYPELYATCRAELSLKYHLKN